MLSPAALEYRRGRVTATDARAIMNAQTDEELLALYDRKIGLAPPIEENYAMRAGSAMEPVILNEIELRTGQIGRRGEIVDHPTIANFCCTLDGWRAHDRAVIEAKFVSPFMSREDIFAFYYAQVAFQMACTNADAGYLVVGQGTAEPIEIECMRSADYEVELLDRCGAFLICMQTMTPPVARPIVTPPERWRTIDLAVDETNWGAELQASLAVYETTKSFADDHEAAGKQARALVPEDVGRVIAAGFTLTRNRKGIISIRRAA